MTTEDPKLRKRLRALWDEAHDFDPKDPLFGLTAKEMSGPKLSRRATLRLLAASGALTTAHLMPGGLAGPAQAVRPAAAPAVPASLASPAGPAGPADQSQSTKCFAGVLGPTKL